MSKRHSTPVDGLVRKNSESGDKWRFFRMAFRHFKMHLCDVEPVAEMIYEATAAPARAPFGGKSAISVHIHASEIERRRRPSALSRFAWNTATIGDLNCYFVQPLAAAPVQVLDSAPPRKSPKSAQPTYPARDNHHSPLGRGRPKTE